MFANIIFSALIGAVSGLLWGLAFGFTINAGSIFGAVVGILIGLLLAFIGKMASMSGNLIRGEANFVNTSAIVMFGILSIGSGGIAWLISFIFF